MPVPEVVREATSRSGVVWLFVGDRAPKPVWHVWLDDADHVLHGGGEQQVAGLAEASRVTVGVRSRVTGGALVRWGAAVRRVDPGSAEWLRLLPLLRGARRNAEADPSERWARTCTLTKLVPTGDLSALVATAGAD